MSRCGRVYTHGCDEKMHKEESYSSQETRDSTQLSDSPQVLGITLTTNCAAVLFHATLTPLEDPPQYRIRVFTTPAADVCGELVHSRRRVRFVAVLATGRVEYATPADVPFRCHVATTVRLIQVLTAVHGLTHEIRFLVYNLGHRALMFLCSWWRADFLRRPTLFPLHLG